MGEFPLDHLSQVLMQYVLMQYLIEGLVPDAGTETFALQRLRQFFKLFAPLFENQVTLFFLNQIHFVDQTKDFGLWRTLHNSFQAGLVVVQILIQLTAFNVKHINKDLYIAGK